MYGIEISIILKNDIVRKQKIYIYTHNNRWWRVVCIRL